MLRRKNLFLQEFLCMKRLISLCCIWVQSWLLIESHIKSTYSTTEQNASWHGVYISQTISVVVWQVIVWHSSHTLPVNLYLDKIDVIFVPSSFLFIKSFFFPPVILLIQWKTLVFPAGLFPFCFSSLRELGKSMRFNCIRFLFIFILKVSYFLF